MVGSKNLNSENWKVHHPNGRHMFTCGEKKATWYLDRGLAVMIDDKNIMFTFDPKGKGFEDNEEFGRSIREIKCVVSGSEEGLQRHHIVPYCYRTYFPEEFKSKNHHDVVLINNEVHNYYEQIANQYKDEIAEVYNVKTINQFNSDYTAKLREISKNNSVALNTINSIFNCYGKMPADVKIKKLNIISTETGIPLNTIKKLTYIQLYKLYLLIKNKHSTEINEFKKNNRYQYDHGYHVIQKLDTEEKIEDFVKLWRKHFIDTMQPKYMPYGWSIDFRIKTKL